MKGYIWGPNVHTVQIVYIGLQFDLEVYKTIDIAMYIAKKKI